MSNGKEIYCTCVRVGCRHKEYNDTRSTLDHQLKVALTILESTIDEYYEVDTTTMTYERIEMLAAGVIAKADKVRNLARKLREEEK